jgi:periplasmic protein TonB
LKNSGLRKHLAIASSILIIGACSAAWQQNKDGSAGESKTDSALEIYRAGGDVKAPKAIHTPDAEYSDQARKKKIKGSVIVSMVVDTDGNPRDVKVKKGLEPSLDHNAVQAVKQWKFEPATRSGKPVAVYLDVSVTFDLY